MQFWLTATALRAAARLPDRSSQRERSDLGGYHYHFPGNGDANRVREQGQVVIQNARYRDPLDSVIRIAAGGRMPSAIHLVARHAICYRLTPSDWSLAQLYEQPVHR